LLKIKKVQITKSLNSASPMNIIVDTNLVFSGILNSSSKIARILTDKDSPFEFYSVGFLLLELSKHSQKLKSITKASDDEISFLVEFITSKIKFIDESTIPQNIIREAFELVKNVDEKDTLFVALTIQLDGILWTGDMKLYKGLVQNNFPNIISTTGISFLLDELQNR
jgi:predicted nucleic acid-binding protein